MDPNYSTISPRLIYIEDEYTSVNVGNDDIGRTKKNRSNG